MAAVRGKGIPPAAWQRSLEDEDVEHESFSVGIKEGIKLAGLGLRMSKFIRKETREGREPFMDPFGSYDVHSNAGVPCGGIGAGSIGRGYKGDFNSFLLRPGRPEQGTVKANQFSLFVKREGMTPCAAVLGCPVDSLEESTVKKGEDDIITMPNEEKLPEDLADAICASGHAEDCDCEDLEDVDISSPGRRGQEGSLANSTSGTADSPSESHGEEEGVGADGSQSERQARSACLPRRTTYIKPKETLSGWAWKKVHGTYHGLFPRAWTTYDVHKLDSRLKVQCKQVSPVIAHNYKETSFPVTVFAWEVENTHPTKEVEVSLMFTFQNGVGAMEDYAGGHYNKPFQEQGERRGKGAYSEEEEEDDASEIKGVSMVNKRTKTVSLGPKERATYEDPLTFGIAAKEASILGEDGRRTRAETAQVHCAPSFETTGLGKALWTGFSLAGKALMVGSHHTSHSVEGVGLGSAVSSRVTVPPGTTVEIVFSLSWDQPVVRFGQGRGYHPRYTRFYGISGSAAPQMCVDALRHWTRWDSAIEAWQDKILGDASLPDSYKCSLFNQLYYLVSGGSVWLSAEESLATKQSLCLSDPTLHEQDARTPQPGFAQKLTDFEDLKSETEGVTKDFLGLTEGITEGFMLKRGKDETGKIVFSLDEIEVGVTYTTLNGHSVVRSPQDTTVVLLNGSVRITPADAAYGLELPDLDGIEAPASAEGGCADGLQMIDGNFGQLLYLESLEYQMYNTYDVHFYASFALILLWPELELNLQRDFARAALIHAPSMMRPTLHSGEVAPRKIRGAIPHDVGCPGEDPLYNVNSYCIHDVNKWKDLNSKFALQVYRDYVATKNLSFLEDVFPVVWECMLFLERFDRDRDGVIENQNFPDQTYDTWAASGMSAYCGGLWLAALSASAEMAKILKKDEECSYFSNLLDRGRKVLHERLWNGKYFLYDASGRHDDTVMADQLAGQWYCRAAGLPPLFPEEDIRTALLSIFQHNFLSFNNGKMGVVNGYNTATKDAERISFQAAEVWTGTTYGLAACMFQEGLEEEAWAIVNSMYNAVFKDLKYWFQIPEAWDERGRYRAFTYMRPLSIWAVQWAADRKEILAGDAERTQSTSNDVEARVPEPEASEPEPEPEPEASEPEQEEIADSSAEVEVDVEAPMEEPDLDSLEEPDLDNIPLSPDPTGDDDEEAADREAEDSSVDGTSGTDGPENDSGLEDQLAEVELSDEDGSEEAAGQWPDDEGDDSEEEA